MSDVQMWATGVSLLTGFALSVLATGVVRRVAIRRDFVDQPGGHKRHATPVALGGGIAITFAMVAPIAAGVLCLLLVSEDGEAAGWLPESIRIHVPGLLSKAGTTVAVAVGALVLHALGLVDDKMHLGPWPKLGVQIAVAAALAMGFDIRLLSVLGDVPSLILTVLWIVLITNAFNFLDNMDGLCAGVAAIAAGIFALSAVQIGQVFVPALATLFLGVMVGYLWYNFPPARIFMGDAGSLVIGYFLALLTVLTTYVDKDLREDPYGLLMPVVLLAVPLYDTASVVFIRLRQGTSPLRGDQRHFSHRLVQRGMSPRNAVLTIYLATVTTGLGALMLPGASRSLAGVVLCQCLCVVLIIAILEQVKAR